MSYNPQLIRSITKVLARQSFTDLEHLSRELGHMGNQVCQLAAEMAADNSPGTQRCEALADAIMTIGFCLSTCTIQSEPKA